GDSEYQEKTGVDVGRDLKWNPLTFYIDPVAKRNHGNRSQRENNRDQRRGQEQWFVDVRRRQIFLEKEFDSVGRRLQQSEWPHLGGTPPFRNAPDDFAFEPTRISDRRQQNEQDDC